MLNIETRYADSTYWGYVRAVEGAANSFVRSLLTTTGVINNLNTTAYLINAERGIAFRNSAIGAPAGLEADIVYYGYLKAEAAYTTTSYSTTYGVYQTLSVPALRKTFHRWVYVGSTTDFPDWEEIGNPKPLYEGTATLPTTNWTAGTGADSGSYYYDIPVPGVTTDLYPVANGATRADKIASMKANVIEVESVAEAIRIWTQKVPAVAFNVVYRVWRRVVL